MSTTGNIRIIGFIKRRPDLTEEQFYEHWGNIHGPLVAPWAVKHGIISYSQVRLVYRNTMRVPDTALPHYVPHLLFYDQRPLTMGMQVHTNSELRAQWSAMLAPGQNSFDFDGAGFMEVKSHEQFLTACQDPYFHEVILKDELNFLDKTNTLMATSTMGLNKDFVVGGKVVGDTTKSEMVLRE
jgi:hypothetical protein